MCHMSSDVFLKLLLLSDMHIGKPESGGSVNRKRLYESLLNDIKKMKDEYGCPDLIVFCGDLAYGNLTKKGGTSLKSQYIDATDFLDHLFDTLGTGKERTPFVCVPGNHDVDREKNYDALDDWISGISTSEKVNKQIDNNTREWKDIISKQEEWHEFYKSYYAIGEATTFYPKYYSSITSLQVGDRNIKVIGLNSAWSAYTDGQDGKIIIGEQQVREMLSYTKPEDFVIVVSHYHIDELAVFERYNINALIESRSKVFLHGHKHKEWYQDMVGHISVFCGSLYDTVESINTYEWLMLSMTDQESKLVSHKYSDIGTGGWSPNSIPSKINDDGYATLIGLMNHGDSAKRNEQQPLEKTKELQKRPPRKEMVRKLPVFSEVKSIQACVDILVSEFKFRWERQNALCVSDKTVLYWPVRLHLPTPIHAVQTFAAAALAKLGAEVVLFVDDLGNTESTLDQFYLCITRWFKKVDNNFSDVTKILCSETVSQSSDVWQFIQSWYKRDVLIKDVFKVVKLTDFDNYTNVEDQAGAFVDLSNRRPRKLMTPPIVWSGLVHVHHRFPDYRVITLGGYDEAELWSTWREKIDRTEDVTNCCVGHLYIPALSSPLGKTNKPLYIADPSLKMNWTAIEDIQNSLQKEYETTRFVNLKDHNRMFLWALLETCLLPCYVKGCDNTVEVSENQIKELSDLKKLQLTDEDIDSISTVIAEWLL